MYTELKKYYLQKRNVRNYAAVYNLQQILCEFNVLK